MLCPDCGFDLSGLTVDSVGMIECPGCGKSAFIHPTNQTTSFRADPPLILQGSDRFDFLERIGEGSFGIVFKAYDRELRRNVAIKTPKELDRSFRVDLFLREARAASQLRHPNIVSIFDVIQSGNLIHIVSEYVEGASLRHWLDRHRPTIEECCRMVSQICAAVDYAHERGIVHRDIKPANIVIDEQSVPHLLDFGLSYSRQQKLESIGIPGQPVGTPAFMAPEQVRGDSSAIDRWTDVYAIGIILYQLLTRQLPFHGRSSQLFHDILETAPPKLREHVPSIAPSLEAICLKSLAKNPKDRYPTAKEMAQDLSRFLNGEIVSAYGKHDTRSLKKLARRQLVTGLASVMGVGLVGTGLALWRIRQRENPMSRVMIEYDPSDATVWFDPINTVDGFPDETRREEVRSGKVHRLAPGYYRVTIEREKESFYVYRTVPRHGTRPIDSSSGIPLPHRAWSEKQGIVSLPKIVFWPLSKLQGPMVFHSGGELKPTRAIGMLASHVVDVKPFLIDQYEVTQEEFLRVFPTFHGHKNAPYGKAAIRIEFEHAISYAEAIGKQIPTAWQWLWAATNGSTTRFPWGDDVKDQTWPEHSQSESFSDVSRSSPPVIGLYSSALEWADTPQPILPPELAEFVQDGPHRVEPLRYRAIVGGPLDFAKPVLRLSEQCEPMEFSFEESTGYFPNVGFRCSRNV